MLLAQSTTHTLFFIQSDTRLDRMLALFFSSWKGNMLAAKIEASWLLYSSSMFSQRIRGMQWMETSHST